MKVEVSTFWVGEEMVLWEMREVQAHLGKDVKSSLVESAQVRQGEKCGNAPQGCRVGTSHTESGSCPYSDLYLEILPD